jgi:hypothetical protein
MTRTLTAVVSMTLVLAASACAHRPGAVDPSTGPTTPVVFVTLGGDETAATDLPRERALRDGWSQLVFRTALPRRSTHVNLAFRNATAADVLADQLPDALTLHPTIAVVWLGAADAAGPTPAARFGAELGSVAGRLRAAGARVFVIDSGGPYDAVIRAAAADAKATVVKVDVDAPLGVDGHRAVADAVGRAIGPVR